MTPQPPSTLYVLWLDAAAKRYVDVIPADIIRDPALTGKFFKHQVFAPIGQFYGWAEYRLTTDGTIAELEYPSELPANRHMDPGALRLRFARTGVIEVEWRDEGGEYQPWPAVAVLELELAALCAASLLDGSRAQER